jgi:hypothetical protein
MRFSPTVASILVGIAPVLWLYQYRGVPTKISVGYGALVWLVAVLVKTAIFKCAVDPAVRRGTNHRSIAVLQGLLSAVTELGIAAGFFFFFWQPATSLELIAIGAGAGMAEAVTVPALRDTFKGTSLESQSNEIVAKTSLDPRLQWLGVLERVLATLVHISSRALVYLTIASGNPVPLVIGACGFACIDGVAFYGYLRKWPIDEPRTLLRMYIFVGGVAAAMVGASVVLVRTLDVFA